LAAQLRLALLRPVQWNVLSAARRVDKADNTDLVERMNKAVTTSPAAAPQKPSEPVQPRTAFAPAPEKPKEPTSRKLSVSSRLA
jgi:hypothetical protein